MTLGAARVLVRQPDRVAAAWRRIRSAQSGSGRPLHNMLEDMVEPFLREIGLALEGAPGSPWSRTHGVLRLAPARGALALAQEFESLENCLEDALEVLHADRPQQARTRAAIHEAHRSALTLLQRLQDARVPPPLVPFGGLVVEHFETELPPLALRTPQLH